MNQHDTVQHAAAIILAGIMADRNAVPMSLTIEDMKADASGKYAVINERIHYRADAKPVGDEQRYSVKTTREEQLCRYAARMAVTLVDTVQRELNKP